MSYDIKHDTITVNKITYDVERANHHNNGEILTIEEFPGLEGRLGYEECAHEFDNPRSWSNVGHMAITYRGYELGDEDIEKIDFEIECDKCKGYGASEHWIVGIHETATRLAIGSEDEAHEYLNNLPDVESGKYYIEELRCDKCDGESYIALNPAEYFIRKRGATVVMPLFVYEHSGITIRAGAPIKKLSEEDIRSTGRFVGDDAGWDTSFVGFIYDTPEGRKQCIGEDATQDQIIEALDGEVQIYASYLEGDITWYSVEDDETDFQEGCGSFVGDHEECESQCFADMETAIEKRLQEMKERAEMAARDIETV